MKGEERCCACDDPTGKAGVGDGSLYTDSGIGPFCESCYGGAKCVEASLIREIGEVRQKLNDAIVDCAAWKSCSDAGDDVIGQLRSALVAAQGENRILREELWQRHGHGGLYGDDGEMQCAIWPMTDFKRDPIEKIAEHLLAMDLERQSDHLKGVKG